MFRSFVVLEQGRFGQTEGQGLVEYALIIALLALALVATLMAMSNPVNGIFGGILQALNGVNAGL